MPDRLLDDEALESSAVVANSSMNRERQLAGVNSYARELGFNPLDWVIARARQSPPRGTIGWLDLCCGSGRGLVQAANTLARDGLDHLVTIVGVDLVDFFDPTPVQGAALHLTCASVVSWSPPRRFDLITCVHGLHYVGDKLAVLTRVASWLTEDGRFVADLDLDSIRLADGRTAGRKLATALREAGFTVDTRRRRITRNGAGDVSLPYTYLGADDRAGPNYTGQPAVSSYYRHRQDSGADSGE
ncbi:methyltransferase domain-containing protein [Micromonospora terminaliae]|uniref:Class I SAM-dependent methyltransferase n=1 Tax=Micromonospora terminaliae TaxID=1914461 RepID=A0AAJ3DKR8_9ACTN|nr:methyltransferase domain-containing protein [Micromonospora terminaliae]NES30154.1 class I SAM-dependent methyltransferase [Micromonospora terminaliae]QGL47069.1 methyltransferase domain-containing protein [Micromonospora terminaliae]